MFSMMEGLKWLLCSYILFLIKVASLTSYLPQALWMHHISIRKSVHDCLLKSTTFGMEKCYKISTIVVGIKVSGTKEYFSSFVSSLQQTKHEMNPGNIKHSPMCALYLLKFAWWAINDNLTSEYLTKELLLWHSDTEDRS